MQPGYSQAACRDSARSGYLRASTGSSTSCCGLRTTRCWSARSPVSWPSPPQCTSREESTGTVRCLQRARPRHGLRRLLLATTHSRGFSGRGAGMQSQPQGGLHVAIIMDGNGRWATRRGLPRVAGHRAGVETVRRIVEHAPEAGIARLTLYAFSSDNWTRPAAEVQSIFWLMRAYLRLETKRLNKRGVKLQMIGRRDRLPQVLLREIERAESATSLGPCLHLRVALDYSSRDAIAQAAAIAGRSHSHAERATPDQVRLTLAEALTQHSSDVDLLIRTGGEK